MKLGIVDYSIGAAAFLDAMTYEPIGVVIENDGGGLDLRYTDEAEESSHPRFVAMQAHLQGILEQWRRGEFTGPMRPILSRLISGSYPGVKHRVGFVVGSEVTTEEAFQRFVVDKEPVPSAHAEEFSDYD